MAEQFANNAVTSLLHPMGISDTTLTVVDPASFPLIPEFRLLIDLELMYVTAVAGAVFTVTRAIEGTTATAHTISSEVVLPFTAASIQNVHGPAGTPGTQFRTGTGVPSNSLGIDGDLYLRTTTGDVYLRSSGTYSIVENIIGPTGATGATGAAGTPGTQFRTGTTVPSNSLGIDGDLYLRTTTGDVYLRSSGTYSIIENITGPTGATGPNKEPLTVKDADVPAILFGADGDVIMVVV